MSEIDCLHDRIWRYVFTTAMITTPVSAICGYCLYSTSDGIVYGGAIGFAIPLITGIMLTKDISPNFD